jgi:DNA-binding beta-propeller fold protein YncE
MRTPALLMATAIILAPSLASAATLLALTGESDLVMIDTATRKASKATAVIGAPARLLGIDVRPADGMLYGLAQDGTIVTIDAASGKASVKSKLDTMLPVGTTSAVVDFNPAADRLRVIGADGTNLRANVDDGKVTSDGKLKFAEGDANKSATPAVTAGAYTNSVKGTKETALLNIDTGLGGLVRQAPPNEGVLNAVGMLGMKPSAVAFDIQAEAQGSNTGWLVADGALHQVDLASGKATMVGPIEGLSGAVRDIAVMPAM